MAHIGHLKDNKWLSVISKSFKWINDIKWQRRTPADRMNNPVCSWMNQSSGTESPRDKHPTWNLMNALSEIKTSIATAALACARVVASHLATSSTLEMDKVGSKIDGGSWPVRNPLQLFISKTYVLPHLSIGRFDWSLKRKRTASSNLVSRKRPS